jgi:hypothetical protein
MNIVLSKNLYIGDEAAEALEQMKKDLLSGNVEQYKHAYVVILALNPENLLELIPVRDLVYQYYQDTALLAVGLAASHGEAKELVRRIVEDVYNRQHDTDVRRFFQDSE